MKRSSKLRDNSIQFMIKSCGKYKFRKDTLFLAIKIMDSLIQEGFNPIVEDYQLASTALILIATKYNEVYPVTIDQMNLITEKYYPREKLIEVEGLILECLNF